LLAGVAPAGNEVELYLDGNPACSARANAQGRWSCLPATGLSVGLHVAVAIAFDDVGNASAPSEGVAFTVSAALPPSPQILDPAAGAWLNTKRPLFHGSAEAGLRVELRVQGALVCATIASEAGEWNCLSAFDLKDGRHEAQALTRD